MNPSTTPYDAASPRLGVVVPLANEEATIDEFLRRVMAQLGEHDRLFCVLDNVCKDKTRDKVDAAATIDPRITCVWAPQNRCVVDAYFSGYKAALDANCRWILEMDGGLSHSPEKIPEFVQTMETGVDFAPGSRFCKGGKYSGRWTRWALSKGGTVLATLVLGTRMSDMTSGFECFTHRALRHVVARGVKSRAHFFQTEIRYMLQDWRWTEVPISYSSPSETVGSSTVGEALKNLWHLRKESRLSVPTGDNAWNPA
jgi:dolichol-phosphate mannosyltransferase